MKKSMVALVSGFLSLSAAHGAQLGGKPSVDGGSFYETNPTYKDAVDDQATWTFSTPKQAGLNEQLLQAAARQFGQESHAFSMLVVRHDALVYERYFHGSQRRHSNNVHSSSKSILSAAVGIAIEKGYLKGPDQPLTDFFANAPRQLTLRHLLTMSAGIDWVEDESEYELEREPNWVKAILEWRYPKEPGREYHYSTALTHLMSAVLTKATGKSTSRFVNENLFSKIGIREEHWGQDPQGINSGGYNLYLTPRELAKFGRLYLHGGEWQGKQVVPKAWVEQSLAAQIHARDDLYYGFNWFRKKMNGYDVHFAWGYGGQFVYLVPALDMVVVFTNNTRTLNNVDFEGDNILKLFVLPAASN